MSPSRKIVATLFLVPAYLFLVIAGAFYFDPRASSKLEKLGDLAKLGEFLFNDTNLSEPRGLACVSCHQPALQRQGNNGSKVASVAAGSRELAFGKRNVPSVMYAFDVPQFSFVAKTSSDGKIQYEPVGGFFWDGRSNTLADQIIGPLLNPVEMNNTSIEAVVARVKLASYADLARKVFGADVFDEPHLAIKKLGTAISAYERSEEFSPFSSKFDKFLRGQVKLTDVESKGFALFQDPNKGNCISCHVGVANSKRPEDWLFTDFSYDTSGIPRNPDIPVNQNPSFYDLGLCAQPGISARAPLGLNTSDFCGAFKVPTLRNVAATAPYFHNGSIEKLRRVVEFYATRDTQPEQWYSKSKNGRVLKYDDLPEIFRRNVNTDEMPYGGQAGGKPRLSESEVDAITAFLETLTDTASAD